MFNFIIQTPFHNTRGLAGAPDSWKRREFSSISLSSPERLGRRERGSAFSAPPSSSPQSELKEEDVARHPGPSPGRRAAAQPLSTQPSPSWNRSSLRRQPSGRGPKQVGAGRARVAGRLLLLTSPLLRTEAAAAERLAETKRGCRRGAVEETILGRLRLPDPSRLSGA